MEESVVGDLINFRGLVYAPINENGVVFLFGKVVEEFNMYIEEIKPGFPDCIARRFIGKGWKRVRIEFEHQSKNFLLHGHNPDDCDIIVCWEHNWKECTLEVIELKSEIKKFDNYPVQAPKGKSPAGNGDFESYFQNKDISESIKATYKDLEDKYGDDAVWQKYGAKYIGWYSPDRAFASFMVSKNSIKLELFCGDSVIEGTKVCNQKFSPRWCRIYLKNPSDVNGVLVMLKTSQERIGEAIKKGEPTGYFSGGQPFGQGVSVDDEEESSEGS